VPIAVGLALAVLADALTAKTTDLLVTGNVVGVAQAQAQAVIAAGLRRAVLVGALTAKTTDLPVTSNVVGVAQAQAQAEVVLLRRQGIGIVAEVVAARG